METDILEPEVERESEIRSRAQHQYNSHGRNRDKKGHGRQHSGRSASEQTPLLRRPPGSRHASKPTGNEWPGQVEFEGLPWTKRPSIFWMLPPFLIFTLAFGGTIVPKLNLITDLICREYYAKRARSDPNFTYTPIKFGASDEQCAAPEVQRAYTLFTITMNLIGGTLAALMSPKLGALSDRYGRKLCICATTFGIFTGEIITIFAGTYPDTFPLYWFYIGYALDGLCGSFTAGMAIAICYASDCTPPARRNVAFGYFQGCLFVGIAVGPFIAGQIIRVTSSMLSIFYVALVCHVIFVALLLFVIPESLSKERQMVARERYEKEFEGTDQRWHIQVRDFFGTFFTPLKILYPKGAGTSPALRRNLLILCAIDTTVMGVALGSLTIVVIYIRTYFGWSVEEQSNYVSIVNICRVLVLFVCLPGITRLVRGPVALHKPQPQSGCDTLDLTLIRLAIVFDTLGYLGYTLSRSGLAFVLSGCVTALGGIGSPTMQSALTKHVPATRTGELLGATGLLHALARVIAPLIFSAIYWLTVATMQQAVFICLTSCFGLAAIMSLFLRAGVYLDDPTAEVPPRVDDSEDAIPAAL